MGLLERGLTIFALVQRYTFESNFFVFAMVFQLFLYLMNLRNVLKGFEGTFFYCLALQNNALLQNFTAVFILSFFLQPFFLSSFLLQPYLL